MQARHVALAVLAALVALGGVYLLIEVRAAGGEKAPPPRVLEEAQRHQARPSSNGTRSSGADGSSESPPSRGEPRAKQPALTRGLDPPINPLDRVEPATSPAPEVNPDLDAALLEANKAYDRKDFEGAREIALKLLQTRAPGNVRMLRVVVSSACILGDAEQAVRYAADLPAFDKQQMTNRCAQYGITLP